MVWLHASSAAAQYRVDTWTTEQGLSQNIVRAVHTGRDGYLWLTTLDGVARFDGLRFTLFDRANSEGIGSNRFTPLLEAPDGAIWLGTENGGITRYFEGRFTTYTTSDGLASNVVSGITADQQGHLWALSGDRIVEWTGQKFQIAKVAGSLKFKPSEWTTDVFWAIDGYRHCIASLEACSLLVRSPRRSPTFSRIESRRTIQAASGSRSATGDTRDSRENSL